MYHLILVAAGGAIGASLRHLSNLAALRFLSPNFPFGTAFVNVSGSFLMGIVMEIVARRFGASNELRLFLAVGLLGGFTTFSSFSLDAVALYERGAFGLAAFYVIGSVVAGIAALFAGFAAGRGLV
ncbi:fluoride efflux transporter CrcB [Aurantimonas sp. C2-6-R+9]|uniref:fluoride efflux transporter CrcB n=1 Tax=unclassified Aurantimonas TaxID=2638230 RepID=UPI002E186708|nr:MULTISPECIES: fluoride efflux transporter CrcB [unclassified Aurantimonas]MEC5290443.1 fluoride efflux transporter CrcB [Aurantimonas sp. C2-3-R2]MEC5323622.1 fluoride efflux transporter CrcB [Aurantimonas sp. A3-2-R12]MEC5380549.1 fluoride efflux transporter CrcB [Aurantimonas sp. C2-6-R+9]MEC5411611.1 fluoride efflux transporter CrcB [Aurantimonas sp. C2-4-R8]